MKKQHFSLLLCFCLLAALLTSCVENTLTVHRYGFFGGLVHGLVFPFALFSKLLGWKYGLHALNNTGFFYWLGYIIGFGALGSSGIFAGSRKRK